MAGLIVQIIRGVLTCGLAGATIYLWVTGKEVPEGLLGFTGLAVGTYFKEASNLVGGAK